MPFIFEIEMCTKKRMQIYKICINYLLKFYKNKKEKCMEQDRPQKACRITESRRLMRSGRRYFVISPGSIPLNRKVK